MFRVGGCKCKSFSFSDYKCRGCIPTLAIDIASWLGESKVVRKMSISRFGTKSRNQKEKGVQILKEQSLGYCNSMLNPIIYSFTVREFKRSAIRLILPLWRLGHRCCPFCVPVPPEHVASRMSRNGHRHRNKSRPRSFELGTNRSGVITSRVSNRRRQTEPAVFSLAKPGIIASPQVRKERRRKDNWPRSGSDNRRRRGCNSRIHRD